MNKQSPDNGTPLSGVRELIARRMRHSLAEAAQLSYFADVDVTDVAAMRQVWRTDGIIIGMEDLVLAALTATLPNYPDLNATFSKGRLSRHGQIDISIAIASPAGLVAPVLRNLASMSLRTIAEMRRDLVNRAAAGKLSVAEMKGGSFTISNLGLTRVHHFTPILNHPQVAILGIGCVEDVVKAAGSTFSTRKMMPISLTTDHQIVDGAAAGSFISEFCDALEHPSFRA
jgi:pyruvate dehydrogenase E2 component (dihydrolipoamide acetyltransferase)